MGSKINFGRMGKRGFIPVWFIAIFFIILLVLFIAAYFRLDEHFGARSGPTILSDNIWGPVLIHIARYKWIAFVLMAWFFFSLRKYVDDYDRHIKQLKITEERIKRRFCPGVKVSKIGVLIVQAAYTLAIMVIAIGLNEVGGIPNRIFLLASIMTNNVVFITIVLVFMSQMFKHIRGEVRAQYIIKNDDEPFVNDDSCNFKLELFHVAAECTPAVLVDKAYARPIAIDDLYLCVKFCTESKWSTPNFSDSLYKDVNTFLLKMLNNFSGSRYSCFATTIGELEAHFRERLADATDDWPWHNKERLKAFAAILMFAHKNIQLRQSLDELHLKNESKNYSPSSSSSRAVVKMHINRIVANPIFEKLGKISLLPMSSILTPDSLFELRNLIWRYLYTDLPTRHRRACLCNLHKGTYRDVLEFVNERQPQQPTLSSIRGDWLRRRSG